MPYATEVMGVGSYVGEVEEGPDGQLYEWVEGVDGLGNPLGFWKGLRRVAGGLARRALPIAARFARFTPYGAAAGLVAPRLFRFAQRQFFHPRPQPPLPSQQYPQYPPSPQSQPAPPPMMPPSPMPSPSPPMQPAPMAPTPEEASPETAPTGAGQVVEGVDGQLYEVVEGIGEFGEPRRLFRQFRQFRRRRRDRREEQQQEQQQQQMQQRFQNLRGRLKNIREHLAEGPDGQLYEYVEGIGAFGESKPYWRRVRLCFPAAIGPRRGRGRSYRRSTTTSSSSPASSATSPYRRY